MEADMHHVLEELPMYSDEEPMGGFVRGRALSRTEKAVHVASPYGIVEVPLAIVTHFASRPNDPTLVTLHLSDPAAVRIVFPVRVPGYPEALSRDGQLARVRLPGSKGWFLPNSLFGHGSTMTEGEGEDTATVCGEVGPDSTDDHTHPSMHDDPPPGMGW
ncbi:hypothetical protein AB0E66_27830 [Streptomyces sp. NPDC033753]|uniref:hypothetical protein n=1 Tax=Streptomyces sp. NPDC033753 TaxID=3155128 RepID=UPI0033CDB6A3